MSQGGSSTEKHQQLERISQLCSKIVSLRMESHVFQFQALLAFGKIREIGKWASRLVSKGNDNTSLADLSSDDLTALYHIIEDATRWLKGICTLEQWPTRLLQSIKESKALGFISLMTNLLDKSNPRAITSGSNGSRATNSSGNDLFARYVQRVDLTLLARIVAQMPEKDSDAYLKQIFDQIISANATPLHPQISNNPVFILKEELLNKATFRAINTTITKGSHRPAVYSVYKTSIFAIKRIDSTTCIGGIRGIEAMLASALVTCSSASSIAASCVNLHPWVGIILPASDWSSSSSSLSASKFVYCLSDPAPLGSLESYINQELAKKLSAAQVSSADLLSSEGPVSAKSETVTSTAPSAVTLTPQGKLSVLLDVANAISHLHAHGMVHGRLAPCNVLLFPGNRAKVCDFSVHSYSIPISSLPANVQAELAEPAVMSPVYSARWQAPEIASARHVATEISKNDLDLINNVSASTLPMLEPSIDSYGIGLTAFALVTNHIPFYNIPCSLDWEEGIRQMLSRGEVPQLPAKYADKTTLAPCESFIQSCLHSDWTQRPTGSSIKSSVSELYTDCEMVKINAERAKRQKQIDEIQGEVNDLSKKVRDKNDLVVNGRKIIKTKESNVRMIVDANERRAAEKSITTAMEKLEGFENELNGLTEDLEAAKEDLDVLIGRQSASDAIIAKGKSNFLSNRDTPLSHAVDAEKWISQMYHPDVAMAKKVISATGSNINSSGIYEKRILTQDVYIDNYEIIRKCEYSQGPLGVDIEIMTAKYKAYKGQLMEDKRGDDGVSPGGGIMDDEDSDNDVNFIPQKGFSSSMIVSQSDEVDSDDDAGPPSTTLSTSNATINNNSSNTLLNRKPSMAIHNNGGTGKEGYLGADPVAYLSGSKSSSRAQHAQMTRASSLLVTSGEADSDDDRESVSLPTSTSVGPNAGISPSITVANKNESPPLGIGSARTSVLESASGEIDSDDDNATVSVPPTHAGITMEDKPNSNSGKIELANNNNITSTSTNSAISNANNPPLPVPIPTASTSSTTNSIASNSVRTSVLSNLTGEVDSDDDSAPAAIQAPLHNVNDTRSSSLNTGSSSNGVVNNAGSQPDTANSTSNPMHASAANRRPSATTTTVAPRRPSSKPTTKIEIKRTANPVDSDDEYSSPEVDDTATKKEPELPQLKSFDSFTKMVSVSGTQGSHGLTITGLMHGKATGLDQDIIAHNRYLDRKPAPGLLSPSADSRDTQSFKSRMTDVEVRLSTAQISKMTLRSSTAKIKNLSRASIATPSRPQSGVVNPMHFEQLATGRLAVVDLINKLDLDPWQELRMQYIAAARGSWEEALGAINSQDSIDDIFVAKMVECEETPAHLAASTGQLRILMDLIEIVGFDGSIDITGQSPLHKACIDGHQGIVRYLCDNVKCDPCQEDIDGLSPIHYAVLEGHEEVVRYLMQSRGNENVKVVYVDKRHGASLLHWACLTPHVDLIAYLVGTIFIDVDFKAADGSTPLAWACLGGSLRVLKYIISQGATVRPKLPKKVTPLHLACLSGSISKAIYLMEDLLQPIAVKDEAGNTPFDVAVGACKEYLIERKKKGFLSGADLTE